MKALVYLKSKSIIHRDIKPDNLIFKFNSSKENTIKLIDFGLATFHHQSYIIFKKCGTVGFIAPEVFEQEETSKDLCYDYKSDIYSIGIFFFSMIFGRHPFDGNIINKVLFKNKNSKFKWDEILERGNYNQDEISLLKNMLQSNQDDRKSANDLLSDKYFENTKI